MSAPRDRYAQCDETCTTDCGACKGQGRPKAEEASPAHAVALALDLLIDARDAVDGANRASRRARDWHRAAYAAYCAAVDAEARS